MKQICAWCGATLNVSRGRPSAKISYGICVPCAYGVITGNPEAVQEFIDRMNNGTAPPDEGDVAKAGKRLRAAAAP